MSTRFFIVLAALVWSDFAKATEVKFHGGGVSYELKLGKKSLILRSEEGSRTLPIKKCNKKEVAAYWSRFMKPLLKLQKRGIASKTRSAKVFVNGVEYRVFNFDPAYKSLIEHRYSFVGLAKVSQRACRKKKS